MTHEEKIKLIQQSVSEVTKGRPRQEMDKIVTGIITGTVDEIYDILLDWTNFKERTKTNQRNGESTSGKSPYLLEQIKTIKVKSKLGG